jgi:hypothetical protein
MDMNKFNKRIPLTLVLAGAFALAACNKPAPAPAPVAPPPAPAPAAPPPPPSAPPPAAQVSAVLLGNAVGADGKITSAVGTFGTKDTIYASVTVNTTQPNVTLGMRWKFQDGQTVADNAKTVASANQSNVIEDKLSKPSGWPVGNYTLEVTNDGKTLSTTTFQVK